MSLSWIIHISPCVSNMIFEHDCIIILCMCSIWINLKMYKFLVKSIGGTHLCQLCIFIYRIFFVTCIAKRSAVHPDRSCKTRVAFNVVKYAALMHQSIELSCIYMCTVNLSTAVKMLISKFRLAIKTVRTCWNTFRAVHQKRFTWTMLA